MISFEPGDEGLRTSYCEREVVVVARQRRELSQQISFST